MVSFFNFILLSTCVLLGSCFAAEFSLKAVEYEDLNSSYRLIVGVPGDNERRAEYIKALAQEVASDHSLPNGLVIDMAFMASTDSGFDSLFPLHVGSEKLELPAIRLMSTKNGDFMSPDWSIDIIDFQSELSRLVEEFVTWQTQTSDVSFDADGLLNLHSRNFQAAIDNHETMAVMFYAPWCKYSQGMLPKASQASHLLQSLVQDGTLTPSISFGKVNVDQEAQLRKDYNITLFPTLKIFHKGHMSAFSGFSETASDLASHTASVHKAKYALRSSEDVAHFVALLRRFQDSIDSEDITDEMKSNGVTQSITAIVVVGDRKPYHEAASLVTGSGVFYAHTTETILANMLASQLGKAIQISTVPALVTFSLSQDTEPHMLATPPPTDAETQSWAYASILPVVARFDGSSAQGDQIRNGPISTLMILVADEGDILFEEYFRLLKDTAIKHLGKAFFLYASESDPRIGGILRAAGAQAPAIVKLSLVDDFPPRSLIGNQITLEEMGHLLNERHPGNDEL